jgi:hypothetical protein
MNIQQLREEAAVRFRSDDIVYRGDDWVPPGLLEDYFVYGAEWEANRPKWFDPKNELPPESTDEPHLTDLVLVQTESHGIQLAWYNFVYGDWHIINFENPVYSIKKLAYIPNF